MENDKIKYSINGPHLKVCLYCGEEFFGRSNQKFCNQNHKATYNNLKSSKINSIYDPWFAEMKTSHQALVKALNKRDEKGWVYIGELTKFGFNPDCSTKKVTSKEGIKYSWLFDVVYRLSDNKFYVQISKYE